MYKENFKTIDEGANLRFEQKSIPDFTPVSVFRYFYVNGLL